MFQLLCNCNLGTELLIKLSFLHSDIMTNQLVQAGNKMWVRILIYHSPANPISGEEVTYNWKLEINEIILSKPHFTQMSECSLRSTPRVTMVFDHIMKVIWQFSENSHEMTVRRQ